MMTSERLPPPSSPTEPRAAPSARPTGQTDPVAAGQATEGGGWNLAIYGLLGLIGIFAPGMLAMAAVLPFWSTFRHNLAMQSALRGINASVVGILFAAFVHPLWSFTIHRPSDFCFALLAFAMLVWWKLPSWIVVVTTVTAYMLFVRIV